MQLCRYFFQSEGGGDQDENETVCTMYLPDNATVLDVKSRFPFEGEYHFRLKVIRSSDYFWMDLTCDTFQLPQEPVVELKVLQLSSKGNNVLIVDEMSEIDFQKLMLKPNSNDSFRSVLKGMGLQFKKKVLTHLNQPPKPVIPSSASAAQLSQLIVLFTTPFQHSNAQHVDLLKIIWKCVGWRQPFEPITSTWQQIGFQTSDPAADLRGILSLHCLVYFVDRFRPFTQEKTYPFAAVGVNLTLVLIDLLDLQSRNYIQRPELYWKLFEDPDGFYEAYCLAFRTFDRFWTEEHGQQHDFPRILERTKRFMYNLFELGPNTVDKMLQLASETIPNV